MRYRLRMLLNLLLAWLSGKQSTETAFNKGFGYFERLEGRFTDRVRKVLSLSNLESANLGHEYIGPEHLLLAILKEGGGVACAVLRKLSRDDGKICTELENYVIRGPKRTEAFSQRLLTPRAVRVIASAKEEAASLNHDFVDTEHILLGLMREIDSLPVQVLLNLGIDDTIVRREVQSILGIK